MIRRYACVLSASLVLPMLCLASCGSGGGENRGGSGGGRTSNSPSASIVLTDAASDEVEVFEVDVKDIVLTKASGGTVSLLSSSARVDFAALESLGDLIVGVGLEAGFYTAMTMTLDFTNATVCLVGQTTHATVLNENGAVITGEVDVAIAFPAVLRPQMIAGRNHVFMVDLDLDQAVAVNAAGNEVTFIPTMTVSIDPQTNKPIAMTGILTAVNPTASTISIEKRTPSGAAIGTFTISVTVTTVFQVNGVVSIGSAGLTALAPLLAVPTRVFVQGRLSTTKRELIADAIESGVGTPGNGQDWVLGHIVQRDLGAGGDATLTVLGRSVDDSTGTRRFNTNHTVSVALANTKVLRRGAGNSLSSDALQVGQRVAAFGTLTGTALDATAGTGVVRMRRTSIFGVAAGSPSSNSLTLNVGRIGLRQIGSFNFTVNGNVEVDAAALTVDVTGLSTGALATGARVRSIGWFNPVSVASDNDFRAVSVVNHTNQARLMLCQWMPPRTDAISTLSSAGLTLDVTNAAIKTVVDGFQPITLTMSPPPSVQPLLGVGLFTIVENGTFELHTDFNTFITSLGSRISATSPVFRITALGTFDESTQAMSTLITTVVLR